MSGMLTSRVHRTWQIILVMFGLTFPVQSIQQINKKCYPVGNRNVCFFRHEPYFTWVTQREAWRICRSNNGTLPMILDRGIQGVFEEYMISLKLTDLDDMWLSGREVRRGEWTWANGVPFTDWPNSDQMSADEMKYSNWLLENGSKPGSECMVVELNKFRWKQENCNSYKRFICQTGPTDVEKSAVTPKSTIKSESNVVVILVAGISTAVTTILLVVVIVVVIVKKRKPRRRQANREDEPRDTSSLNLDPNLDEQGYLKMNQQYTPLQAQTRKPLPPPTVRPLKSQQTELNTDNHYEEIDDTHVPSYLEIIN